MSCRQENILYLLVHYRVASTSAELEKYCSQFMCAAFDPQYAERNALAGCGGYTKCAVPRPLLVSRSRTSGGIPMYVVLRVAGDHEVHAVAHVLQRRSRQSGDSLDVRAHQLREEKAGVLGTGTRTVHLHSFFVSSSSSASSWA